MRRASCAYYAQDTLLHREDPKDTQMFEVADHHMEWNDLVMCHDRICVMAPRDHGKCYFFVFAFPIWKAEFNPVGKGYIFSATQDQAVRILSDIKDEIEDNPKLRHLLPEKREVWNATSVKLANGHRIYARGYGTKLRGAHPQRIVVDDGLNDEDAYSELVRNKHIEYFFTAISNMIVPGGQIVVVGTPFHGTDLYNALRINPEYTFRKYPAVEKGKPLWPGRYSLALLEKKRREIGPIRFTREFLCEPISDDMSIFPGNLFTGAPVEQFNVKLGMPLSFWKQAGIHSVFIGVDLAISASTSADYTVVFVLGIDAHGNRWVLDIIRKQGLPFNKQLALVTVSAKKYDADLIFIEANQMQRVFGDELIRTTDLPVKKFVTTGTGKMQKGTPKGNTTSANKNSLEGGVPALRVLLENQKIRIPRGDAHSIEVTDQWITEMRAFTWLDGKLQGVGAHDDTVMAFWIADQAVKQGGFSFSTGGEEGEGGNLDSFMKELVADRAEEDEEPEDAEAAADKAARAMLGLEPEEHQEEKKQTVNLLDEEQEESVVSSAWASLQRLVRSGG